MKLNKTQCVYVIYNPDFNITKIGIADNVNRRKKELEGACGCELLLHYNTNHIINAIKYETLSHEKLADKRKVGEWFNVTPEEATVIVKTIITDAIEDPIIKAYNDGDSISKIAQDNNVTRQAILARLRDYGYKNMDNNIIYPEPKKRWKIYGSYIPRENRQNNEILSENKTLNTPESNIFLDENIPPLPLFNLKRVEPNINFNGEWYQTSIYKNGVFCHSYTKNIDKAREYIKINLNTPT